MEMERNDKRKENNCRKKSNKRDVDRIENRIRRRIKKVIIDRKKQHKATENQYKKENLIKG